MTDWIKWGGGEQPVEDGDLVDVKLRIGDTIDGVFAVELYWEWGSEFDPDGNYDIVAYHHA